MPSSYDTSGAKLPSTANKGDIVRITRPTACKELETASINPLTLFGTQKEVASHGKRDFPCTARRHHRKACPSILLEWSAPKARLIRCCAVRVSRSGILRPIGKSHLIWCRLADSVILKAAVIRSFKLAMISGPKGTTAVWYVTIPITFVVAACTKMSLAKPSRLAALICLSRGLSLSSTT